MDNIWYRNHSKSEVFGRFGGDGKKRMTTQNRQKIEHLKKKEPEISRSRSQHSITGDTNLLISLLLSILWLYVCL